MRWILSQSPKALTKKQAIEKLWHIPNLSFKLDKTQKEMYNIVRNSEEKIVVLACARGLGKSHWLVTMAMETCIRKPGCIVKYVAPTIKDLKNIVVPIYRTLIADCPDSIMPTYNKSENKIIFPNGSEIQMAGAKDGNAEGIRGTTAELCIVDEAGFCEDLEYIVQSILLPTLRGSASKDKKVILASTPSRSNDHDFIQYMKKKQFEGTLIKKTVYDNARIKQYGYESVDDYISKEIESAYPGGRESTAFKREYLCEILSEEDSMVVPEFTEKLKTEIIKNWEKPSHYDAYASMDIGFRDLTGILFAYYDFKNAKLVIEDELVLSGAKMLTDNLAYEVKQKELMNFKDPILDTPKQIYLRVSDNNNPILLQDLSIKHNLHFIPTAKDNFEAALNNMRIMLKSGKIIINPRCANLIRHLEAATWNKSRSSFARSPDNGHYDLVMALVYLCRNIHTNRNPYPSDGYNANMYYRPSTGLQTPQTEFEKHLVSAKKASFGTRRRK